MIKNNQRLDFIVEQIKPNSVIADIGTDHAYVPIKAVQKNKAIYAFATDINVKPLKFAELNVKNANLEDKIDVVLSNGLDFFYREYIYLDYVIISGLGSVTIASILNFAYPRIQNYLLCSNTEPSLIRQKLFELNLKIDKEYFFYDNDRKYWLIRASYTENEIIMTPMEIFLGNDSNLFTDCDYFNYLNLEYEKLKKIVKLTKDKSKKKEIKSHLKMIKEGLGKCKQQN